MHCAYTWAFVFSASCSFLRKLFITSSEFEYGRNLAFSASSDIIFDLSDIICYFSEITSFVISGTIVSTCRNAEFSSSSSAIRYFSASFSSVMVLFLSLGTSSPIPEF